MLVPASFVLTLTIEPEPAMSMPKIPTTFMQGLIAIALILNFTFMLLAPSLVQNYKDPADGMANTLINLVILAVGYYLGSSSGSARKDAINAAQQDKAMSALSPPGDTKP